MDSNEMISLLSQILDEKIGMVTAYAYAKSKGYSGSADDFANDMANIGVNISAIETAINTFNNQTVPNAETAITTAGSNQVTAVNTAGQEQLQNVTAEGGRQVGLVAAAGSAQTEAVNAAGASQVENVNTAVNTQVSNVNSEGETQITAIQTKGEQTRATIPSDYTALSDSVEDLQTTFRLLSDYERITNCYIALDGTITASSNATDITVKMPVQKNVYYRVACTNNNRFRLALSNQDYTGTNIPATLIVDNASLHESTFSSGDYTYAYLFISTTGAQGSFIIQDSVQNVIDLSTAISEIEHGTSLTIQRAKSDTNQTWGNTNVYFYLYVGQTLTITNNGATAIWITLKDATDTTIGSSFQIASGATASTTISTLPDHVAIYADTYPINVEITSDAMSAYLDNKIDALKEHTEDVTVDYLEGKICYANLSDFDLTQNKYYSDNLTPLTPSDGNTYHIAPAFTVPAGTYSYYGVDSYWSFYVYPDNTQTRLGTGGASGTVTLTKSATIYLTTRENITGYGNENWVSGGKVFAVAPAKGYFSEKIEQIDGFTQIMASVNMFNSVAALGDSYTAASVQNSSGTWGDYPNNSWVATMCKRSGVDWFNYGHGGATTQLYLSTAEFASVLSDTAKDIYFMCFGINDYGQALPVGTVADINDSDYTQNAPSFYGWYGKIIAQIKAHAPKAKIVLIKPWTSAAAKSAYGDAVEGIATHYSIPCIDPYDDVMFYGGYLSPSINAGHPTLMGYTMMGIAMERLFSNSVINNPSYYKYSTVG